MWLALSLVVVPWYVSWCRGTSLWCHEPLNTEHDSTGWNGYNSTGGNMIFPFMVMKEPPSTAVAVL